MPKIGSIGIPELLIILVVVLLIFGPRRLPDMAKGLGQSVREFRKGLRDMRKEFNDEDGDDTANAGAKTAAAGVSAATTAATTTPAEAQPSTAETSAAISSTPAPDTAGDDDPALKS